MHTCLMSLRWLWLQVRPWEWWWGTPHLCSGPGVKRRDKGKVQEAGSSLTNDWSSLWLVMFPRLSSLNSPHYKHTQNDTHTAAPRRRSEGLTGQKMGGEDTPKEQYGRSLARGSPKTVMTNENSDSHYSNNTLKLKDRWHLCMCICIYTQIYV